MPTHLETYRRFEGKLRAHPLRFWPLLVSGIGTATRRKLPLFLLYALPVAWGIVFSFNVYTKYALESGVDDGVTPSFGQRMMMNLAAQHLEVRLQIYNYFQISRHFGILAVAWFGAGLLADDRRYRAHHLYFSRPLTRLDYVLGRFLTVFFFGALATLAPGLMICTTAAFSSPDWAFVRDEPEVIFGTVAYGLILVTFLSLLTLAVSSVAARKSFALAGLFAVILIPHALSILLRRLEDDRHYRMLSPLTSLGRIGTWLLERESRWFDWPVSHSFMVLGAFAALSLVVLAFRLRRLEVVG